MTRRPSFSHSLILLLLTVSAILLTVNVRADAPDKAEFQIRYQAQQELINSFSQEILEEELYHIVRTWLNNQDFYGGNEFSLNFTQQRLLMDEQGGFKIYPCWDLELRLIYDWKSLGDQENSVTRDICSDVAQAFMAHPLGRLLVRSVDVRCCTPNQVTRKNFQYNVAIAIPDFTLGNNILRLQSKFLEFAQELDQKVKKTAQPREIKEICLSQFGIAEGKSKLFAQISVYTSPDEEDLPAYFEQIGREFWESLTTGIEFQTILKDLEVESLILEYFVSDTPEIKEALRFEYR